MKTSKIFRLLLIIISMYACGKKENSNNQQGPSEPEAGTFGYDLNFLQRRDSSIIVLKNTSGRGQVIVSPKYQAKVFTSTAHGLAGKSFGWVNYKAFDAAEDPHMNAYGGENRLWLGPEGGPYSLFFKPGTVMNFTNWVTPAPIDTESWQVLAADSQQVSLQKEAAFLNYTGTTLYARLRRDIALLENTDMEQLLHIKLSNSVQAVGFKTNNAITNTGKTAWNKVTGAPCLWILDMFNPSPQTVVVIPYENKGISKIATTDYFGEIPADRISFKEGILLFKADGKARGKLGIAPERAKPVAGSYDALNNILTITTFEVAANATYLNQEWTTTKDPLQGDAINAYNDGPLADGSQMGPFYEIESVSPAAFLQFKETLNHQHNVFHFTGDKAALNKIAEKVLGISLTRIEAAF